MENILPVISWFSCGVTSAVACKIALQQYPLVNIVYIETGSHHPDNERFIHECETWYGQKIEIIKHPKFSNVIDVIRSKRFINGPSGAPCTYELKKRVRMMYEQRLKDWHGQVFGFDFCEREINRAIRFKQQNPLAKPLFPLIDKHITKSDAMGILKLAGIELPKMYSLGYANNNCIGCVKGGITYWNKIRRDFPSIFKEFSNLEREIDATCLKDENSRIFLDELNPQRGTKSKIILPDCSLFCAIEFENLKDPQTKKVLNGMPIDNTI